MAKERMFPMQPQSTTNCLYCGTTYTPRKDNHGKYCSRRCAARSKTLTKVPIEDRFWAKVNKDGPVQPHVPEIGPCWEWTGGRASSGYGVISRGSGGEQPYTTHVLSWTIHFGPVTNGLHVCHKCDNRKCVNPSHLFLGTHQDNMDDMVQKGRNRRGPVRLPSPGEA